MQMETVFSDTDIVQQYLHSQASLNKPPVSTKLIGKGVADMLVAGGTLYRFSSGGILHRNTIQFHSLGDKYLNSYPIQSLLQLQYSTILPTPIIQF